MRKALFYALTAYYQPEELPRWAQQILFGLTLWTMGCLMALSVLILFGVW